MADNVFFVGPLERVLYLRTVPALEGLSSPELVSVAQFARERHFPKGSFLLHGGHEAAAFYLVVEGRVRVKRPGRPVQVIGPREVVGFLHLLARSEKGLEAQAEVDTLTLEFDSDAQLDLCEEHFPILLNYVRFLSRSLLGEMRTGRFGLPRKEKPGEDLPLRPGGPELVERILALYRSDAFCNCSLDALGELARHLSEVRFQKDQPLWKTGDNEPWFYLLLAGSVGLEQSGAQPLTLLPGSILGMEEAVADSPRWRPARAVAETVALRIDLEPFLDILEDHFQMAMALLSSMAVRLIELQEEAAQLPAGKIG